MDDACECPRDVREYEIPKVTTPNTAFLKIVTIDFGKVGVCGKYVNIFTYQNTDNKEPLSYRIRRDSDVNPTYEVFRCNKHEGFILPKECLRIKILFHPVLPSQKYLDKFEFIDSSFNIIKIVAKGESIGPSINISVKRIQFFITPSINKSKKIFEIKNDSNIPAEFMFDYNNEENVFQVEPLRGTIQGSKYVYIKVAFHPKEFGLFSQQLFCLIWCQDPLVVELFGVNAKKDLNDASFQRYPIKFEETVGYGAYFQGIIKIKNNVPPVALSSYNINFGQILMGNISTEKMYVVNYSNQNIVVKWPEGDKNFKIYPGTMNISPRASSLFECHFTPTDTSAFYHKILTAQVYWASSQICCLEIEPLQKSWNIPITISISVAGHSFTEKEHWLSHIEINPSVITFPPCLPGYNVCTTFKIVSKGHLPVLYRLVAPEKSYALNCLQKIHNTRKLVRLKNR